MIIAGILTSLSASWSNAMSLLGSEDQRSAVILLIVVAFVLGAVGMCLFCRICRRSCNCSSRSMMQQRPYYRREIRAGFDKRRPSLTGEGTYEIYVGNLAYDLSEDTLRKEFEAFGKVTSARIIVNRYTGRSKGFGFIHMANADDASAAVKALNDKDLNGRKLKCNEVRHV